MSWFESEISPEDSCFKFYVPILDAILKNVMTLCGRLPGISRSLGMDLLLFLACSFVPYLACCEDPLPQAPTIRNGASPTVSHETWEFL